MYITWTNFGGIKLCFVTGTVEGRRKNCLAVTVFVVVVNYLPQLPPNLAPTKGEIFFNTGKHLFPQIHLPRTWSSVSGYKELTMPLVAHSKNLEIWPSLTGLH